MNKSSLTRTLLVAGTLAVAGIGAAQADAIFYPDGHAVDIGPTGADNLALSGSAIGPVDLALDPSLDMNVLGAGAATSTTTVTTVPATQYVYVQPNINWDRSTAVSQMHSNAHLLRGHRHDLNRTGATASYNVPARAGEASTLTAGVPNAVTTNETIVVGRYDIPYSSVGSPYYVFSY
jgi:hypothetical protein